MIIPSHRAQIVRALIEEGFDVDLLPGEDGQPAGFTVEVPEWQVQIITHFVETHPVSATVKGLTAAFHDAVEAVKVFQAAKALKAKEAKPHGEGTAGRAQA